MLALVAGLAACGARGEPAQPAPELNRCPLPLVWSPGERHPLGVRVENESGDSVVVFLRECRGSVRVAAVAPAETRLFPLPERLLAFPGGLRFHTVRNGEEVDHRVVTVPVDTARIVALRIPAEPAECPLEVYVNGARYHGRLTDVDPARIIRVESREPSDLDPALGSRCPSLHVWLSPAAGG